MRLRIAVILLGLAVVAAPRPALSCSQCMCGTPFPADALGGVVPAHFTWGLDERYLSKSNALDSGPGEEQEREHRVAAYGLWRPLNRLALVARVPYAIKEITTRPQGDEQTIDRSHGLGDAELLAMVGVVRMNGRLPVTVGVVGGVGAPTGASELKDGSGERLDAHLQTGIGAWTGTGGINMTVATHPGIWEASVLGRASGTNSHGYRYGSVLLYNAGLTSRAWNSTRFLLQLNGRVAAKDRLEDGTPGENTGGSVLYVAPGARWVSTLGLSVEAALQIPVAQSLYGTQTEHTTARLSLAINR